MTGSVVQKRFQENSRRTFGDIFRSSSENSGSDAHERFKENFLGILLGTLAGRLQEIVGGLKEKCKIMMPCEKCRGSVF